MKNLRDLFIIGAILLPFAVNSQYRKTFTTNTSYEMIRNEPAKSGLVGVSLEPVILDAGVSSCNMSAGFTVHYSFKSLLRISGGYRFAYWNNFANESADGAPSSSGWTTYGIPAKSAKASCLSFLVNPTIFSWTKERGYRIGLGYADYRTYAITHINAKVMKSLTGRLGYMEDYRLIQATGSLPFQTTTPAYVYYTDYNNKTTLTPNNITSSATMMKSNLAILGVAYSVFHDLKLNLSGRYHGTRMVSRQTDLFIDFMYAQQLLLQDMIYYHERRLPQRLDISATPLVKTGIRAGFQLINMYAANCGTKFALEGGMRPGVKNKENNAGFYGQLTFGFLVGGRIAKNNQPNK